ncbi:putative alpha/beta superfamily hydrolase [Aspergillus cavernicola]|uniref:Alpha/beta superfamily hydrolase n=1 Tax=Aspergillus cavernicola TaxID=176166 RepID=A0ABR4IT23_9EURO
MKIMGSNIAALGILTTILNPISAIAQNMSYGADNFYRSNNVTIHPISFPTQYRTTVAGNLFIPDTLTTNTSTPAIIIGHPMGAVKEQSANLYATRLAETGFITLSLDLPFWGASTGQPRNAVSAELYAEAFSAAVDYLGSPHQTIANVDRARIGALGICGSGGFLISAAKLDPRIRAIATASMYDMGAVSRNGLQASQSVEARMEVIAQAAEQRWTEVDNDGGEVQYTGGTVDELLVNSTAVEREFYDFYRTVRGEVTPRGSTPELTTHPTLSSNTKFMNFYPFNDIETIAPRPMLFVAGDQAHSREFSEDAFARAGEPKELVWVSEAGHVDLYDRTELIPFDRIERFFREGLV